MNILYIPQLSMHDKQTGKFIPQADGNLNMMRNFISEWKIHKPNDKFAVLLPSAEELYSWVVNLKITGLVALYYKEFVNSARINRFNFPMKEIANNIKTLRGFKVDLVICDVPELSRNIKAMFSVLFGYEPKILSNIRHIDDPSQKKSSYDYTYRLADGIECSDACTILSDSMAEILMNSLDWNLKSSTVDLLMAKVHTFEPSISSKELENHDVKFYVNSKKIITFPGRLSIGEENRTNWDKFAEAIKYLRNTRDDFAVYFTDPNNSLPKDLELEYVYTIPNNRKDYIQLLAKTDIIVSLMAIQGFGGISIREALHFGCYPVIPYVGEYKKMAKEDHYGFIHGEVSVSKIVLALEDALDNITSASLNASIRRSEQFTIEYQMPKLLEKLGGILNG